MGEPSQGNPEWKGYPGSESERDSIRGRSIVGGISMFGAVHKVRHAILDQF